MRGLKKNQQVAGNQTASVMANKAVALWILLSVILDNFWNLQIVSQIFVGHSLHNKTFYIVALKKHLAENLVMSNNRTIKPLLVVG